MKMYLAGILLAVCSAAAMGGDLAAAKKALEAGAYAEAVNLFTPLAEGGNAEAQFHLGEMHWYGEGIPRNDAQAKAWFEKAAAAGSAQAASALAVMQQRVVLKAEIDFYVKQYDGADLAFSAQRCPAPVFPAHSERKADITRLDEDYNKWLACYNKFVATLNSAMPPGKLIPAKVADIMNQQEFAAAQARMDQAYARLGADARLQAAPVLAQHDAWLLKTEEFVKLENQRFEASRVAADAAVRRRANTDLDMTGYTPVRQRK